MGDLGAKSCETGHFIAGFLRDRTMQMSVTHLQR